jgi:2',3'-cyclic-nucleotide 2'-phosphodiesterase (5'-nucleotidase family)
MKYVIGLFFLSTFACHPAKQITSISYKDYVITKGGTADSAYENMLLPYADSVGKTMNEVMAIAEMELLKEMPNSSLGNFLADAYLSMAREKFEKRADIAFMNHGGVRINRIPAGPIPRRSIFEVMPFDNLLVIVEVKGNVLQGYLDKLASEGGGGGVAGLTMKIKNKKAVDVIIGGKEIQADQVYYMVNSDYAVDGGGGFQEFRKLKQQRTQYFLRDAILDYCRNEQAAGKKIKREPNLRITNE